MLIRVSIKIKIFLLVYVTYDRFTYPYISKDFGKLYLLKNTAPLSYGPSPIAKGECLETRIIGKYKYSANISILQYRALEKDAYRRAARQYAVGDRITLGG